MSDKLIGSYRCRQCGSRVMSGSHHFCLAKLDGVPIVTTKPSVTEQQAEEIERLKKEVETLRCCGNCGESYIGELEENDGHGLRCAHFGEDTELYERCIIPELWKPATAPGEQVGEGKPWKKKGVEGLRNSDVMTLVFIIQDFYRANKKGIKPPRRATDGAEKYMAMHLSPLRGNKQDWKGKSK